MRSVSKIFLVFLAFASFLHPFYLVMYVVFAAMTVFLQYRVALEFAAPIRIISYRAKLGVTLRRLVRRWKHAK
jgi:hypothetical protein